MNRSTMKWWQAAAVIVAMLFVAAVVVRSVRVHVASSAFASETNDHDDHDDHDHESQTNHGDTNGEHEHEDHHLEEQTDADHDDHDDDTGHDHAEHADHDDDTGHDHAEHADHDDDTDQDHSDYDDHADHADHDDDPVIRLDTATIEEFGIHIATAGPGTIGSELRLAGQVTFNADRLAHMTPRVGGIARDVHRSIGDVVVAGELMAVLSSREVAAARSDYLAAAARIELARKNSTRDQRLFAEKVATERQVLQSQQVVREAEIQLQLTEQNMYAMGFSHEQIAQTQQLDDTRFSEYALVAPIGGVVIQRHLTLGEVVEQVPAESPFVVADLATVWVDLSVYPRDLARVRAGQMVTVQAGHGLPDAKGKINFVSPSLDEHTRTALARVVLDNAHGHWRPGLFVTGKVTVEQVSAGIAIPRSAVQRIEGRDVVFIHTAEGFEPTAVQLGLATALQVEVLDGLKPGQPYVAANAFVLKAELNRAALEHAGHSH